MNINGHDSRFVTPDLSGAGFGEDGRNKAIRIANQFEQVFVQQMVEAFRKTSMSEENSMFGSGPGSDTYAGWFDQHMSQHLAKNGGVGVAKVILRDLQRFGQLPQAQAPQTPPINHKVIDHVA